MENLSELDDLALVRQIQHGNELAMAEFYNRFAPGLNAFIRQRIQEPETVEDILAETMTAATTAIMRFKGQSLVFTWLCRIAQFKLADFYRRLGQVDVLPIEDAHQVSSNDSNDPEQTIIIWQVLHSLNHEYRHVLEDKYLNGFPNREIAFRMSRTEKAVESVLFRARKAFAREYRRMVPEVEVYCKIYEMVQSSFYLKTLLRKYP